MKCDKCGAENAHDMTRCGNCAEELSGRPRPAKAEPPRINPVPNAVRGESDDTRTAANPGRAEDALVAIAINVRRLFLVALLSIFITMVSSLISSTMTIMILRDEYASSTTTVMMIVLSTVLALVMIVGIIYIIARKRLTKL